MKLESHFSIGDKAWIYWSEPQEVTVGQVQLTYTHRKNKKPELEERYMVHEYGIGSGSFFIFPRSIYATREDCIQGNLEEIKANAEEDRLTREQERKWLHAEIEVAKAKLAALAQA